VGRGNPGHSADGASRSASADAGRTDVGAEAGSADDSRGQAEGATGSGSGSRGDSGRGVAASTPVDSGEGGTTPPPACTKYVSASGSLDGHTAYPSIQDGVNTVTAGDTLCVSAGTYHERVFVNTSGAAGNPITIRAYDASNRPVVDGAYTLPDDSFGTMGNGCSEVDPANPNAVMAPYPLFGCDEISTPGLVILQGNHLVWDGIDITRSRSNGVFMGNVSGNGDYVLPLLNPAAGTWYSDIQFLNSHVSHIRGEGASFLYVDGGTMAGDIVEDSQNLAAYNRLAPGITNPNVSGWGNGVSLVGKNLTFTGNIVFHNWGEGISIGQNNFTKQGAVINGQTVTSSTFTNAQTAWIKGNVVYDNWAAQVYLTNGTDNTLEGNLIYQTADSAYFRYGSPFVCLLIGAENASGNPANITVRNNVIQGCTNLIALEQYESVTRYTNFEFYNNTLVNPYRGGNAVTSNMTGLTRFTFMNNLVYAPGNSISYGFTAVGVPMVGHNVWSSAPPANLGGSGDITTSDPGLATPSYVPPAGGFDVDTIKLAAGSPAIGSGVSTPSVTTDFFGTLRPTTGPDIGAYQHP